VIGIHLDESAISYAKSHYKADFILMDMTGTEFTDNYFDVFVCFAAMGAVGDVQQFFDEVKRLLKPGGIFIVSAGVFGKSFLENKRLMKLASHHFTKDGLISIFKKNFTDVKFYAQEKQFLAFPGRGLINKILGIRRDHTIVPLNDISDPRVVLCVGKPIK